jgi:tRNA-2-methylthio-N6-dimethylallyladenosine synthase
MTSHPKDLSDKLIYAVKNLDKVCEHIHLPLQSASDRILKAMNRKYTSKDYLKIINRMKKEIPGISITTDILVGFPGETKSDFNATLKLVKDTEFDFLFAFKYSPREGTEAAKIRSAVPAEEKERRHALILETTNGISARKNAKLIGTSQEVLVEGKKDNDLTGSTRTNKKVFIKTACPGNSSLTGRLVSVKIEKSKINSLIGNQECANL